VSFAKGAVGLDGAYVGYKPAIANGSLFAIGKRWSPPPNVVLTKHLGSTGVSGVEVSFPDCES